jgi:hypothetical protein
MIVVSTESYMKNLSSLYNRSSIKLKETDYSIHLSIPIQYLLNQMVKEGIWECFQTTVEVIGTYTYSYKRAVGASSEIVSS